MATAVNAQYTLDDDEGCEGNDVITEGGSAALVLNATSSPTLPQTDSGRAADGLDLLASADEVTGVRQILASLTPEEIDQFPDPNMPLRYFRATKGDAARALNALRDTLGWRKEFGVNELVNCLHDPDADPDLARMMRKEGATCKLYVRGYDKDGHAMLYMRPADENTYDELGNIRNLVYHLEKAIACSRKNNVDKVCIIVDYDKYKLRNAPPMATSRRVLDILQNHYPERLYRCYICNPHLVFRTFWALIKPFVDPLTKQKILFCSNKANMARLAKDMGPNAKLLEKCAGGQRNVRRCNAEEYLNLPFDVVFDQAEFDKGAGKR